MKTQIKHNKNNICYTANNLFTSINDRLIIENKGYNIIVPHVCNNVNGFGAGFAYHVQNNFPIVKENFHLLGKKASLGYTQFVVAKENKKTGGKIIFANMIAQNGTISKANHRPLNYASLVKCMIDTKTFISSIKSENDNDVEIHAPKFGSGLAGGNWNFIENLIEDIWFNINSYIYIIK
jgi:hypothetical protein